MHYPLAMRPPALMDQRACREPRRAGWGRYSRTKPTGVEDRGLPDGDRNGLGGDLDERVTRGHSSVSAGSWTHLKGGGRREGNTGGGAKNGSDCMSQEEHAA